jgi:hypothetical protein
MRHRRPSPCGSTRLSQITVAGCFDCRIWIIAKERCLTASDLPLRAGYTNMPSTSSSLGTVRNLVWHSTESWSSAIACTLNHDVWPLTPSTINQQLAAVRRLAHEAADAGLLSPELAAGISRVRGVKPLGFRAGNWLSADESSQVLSHAGGISLRAKRDYAMLAMLFGSAV